MKKIATRMLVGAVLVLGGCWIGATLQPNSLEAESNALTPGSVEDPVVTKSYVDEQLAKLSGGAAGGNTGGTETEASASLEVVVIPAGKTLIAAQGTQVIIRVGKAIVYSADGSGVSDLTDGSERTNGLSVPANHLLLFPRDGRGILPDPAQKNGLTALVIGGYKLQ